MKDRLNRQGIQLEDIGLNNKQCRAARLSRDARFDGLFYVAVKSTGIFCRPVCPAAPPLEENVVYYSNPASAVRDGFRPCMRCRPDSAPGSWAWKGNETTFRRALNLIEQGALQERTLEQLGEKIGVSDRYLRKLFSKYLGLSPKAYSQIHQLMFAKQLLFESRVPITDIAFACGFNSVRRFNDAFRKHFKMAPSQIRKKTDTQNQGIGLSLAFRPPLNWPYMLEFFSRRCIDGVEEVQGQTYRRSFQLNQVKGWFQVMINEDRNAVDLVLELDNIRQLRSVVIQIRRMFDLDSDINAVETELSNGPLKPFLTKGIRIPGCWDHFEAGVRAVLGQQVSVKAGVQLLQILTDQLGSTFECRKSPGLTKRFPTPEQVLNADLSFLKMPTKRRETLIRLAEFCKDHPNEDPDAWLSIPGIGNWTCGYAKLRGLSQPDVFLVDDAVIKKALRENDLELKSQDVSPWGSYATLQFWNMY